MSNAIILMTIFFIEYLVVHYLLIQCKKSIDNTTIAIDKLAKKDAILRKKIRESASHVDIDMKSNFFIDDIDSSNLRSSSEKGEVKTKAEKLRELKMKGKL